MANKVTKVVTWETRVASKAANKVVSKVVVAKAAAWETKAAKVVNNKLAALRADNALVTKTRVLEAETKAVSKVTVNDCC